MFLYGLSHWIPKWNGTSHTHTHPPGIRRGSKEKWLDVELQSRTSSHPVVQETALLSVDTCHFSPKTRLECAFLKIPSAGLFNHFLVFTLLPFLPFCHCFQDELFSVAQISHVFSLSDSVSDCHTYLKCERICFPPGTSTAMF